MIAQTVRPARWVIVSDGSTDGTDDIVSRYAAGHPWIELVRMPERSERHFAGKVHAFNAGYAAVRDVDYDVIASLDADISFGPEYFAFLLRQARGRSARSVWSATPFKDISMYDYRFRQHRARLRGVSVVPAGLLRGHRRLRSRSVGGVDHIAVITARMKGWKTRTFTEMVCHHHRPIGSADTAP